MATRKLDAHGRRIFKSEEKAFKAQQRQAVMLGVFSGVVQSLDGWTLLRDEWALVYYS